MSVIHICGPAGTDSAWKYIAGGSSNIHLDNQSYADSAFSDFIEADDTRERLFLHNGKPTYLFGDTFQFSIDQFNSSSQSWTTLTTIDDIANVNAYDGADSISFGGDLFVAINRVEDQSPTDVRVEVYRLSGGTLIDDGLPAPGFTAILYSIYPELFILNGRLFLAYGSGSNTSNYYLRVAERTSSGWSVVDSLSLSSSYVSPGTISGDLHFVSTFDDRIYAFSESTEEIYLVGTKNEWSGHSGGSIKRMTLRQQGNTAWVFYDQYISGSSSSNPDYFQICELTNPNTRTWSQTQALKPSPASGIEFLDYRFIGSDEYLLIDTGDGATNGRVWLYKKNGSSWNMVADEPFVSGVSGFTDGYVFNIDGIPYVVAKDNAVNDNVIAVGYPTD